MEKYFLGNYTKKELEILKRSNGIDPHSQIPWQILQCSERPNEVFDRLLEDGLLTKNINENIKNMRAVELKDLLRSNNLKVSGNKQALINRVFSELDTTKLNIRIKYYITEKGQQYVSRYIELLNQEELELYFHFFNLIKEGSLEKCYNEICKYQVSKPIYKNGLGMDWNKELEKGLSKKRVNDYMKQLESDDYSASVICCILADMSGDSIISIVSLYNKIFSDSDISNQSVRNKYSQINNTKELEGYKKSGIKEYMFIAALDKVTCPKCGALDGKIIKVKDARIGVNFPPICSTCRCTTVAHLDKETTYGTSRRARNIETGKSEIIPFITYKEWTKQNISDCKESKNKKTKTLKMNGLNKILEIAKKRMK